MGLKRNESAGYVQRARRFRRTLVGLKRLQYLAAAPDRRRFRRTLVGLKRRRGRDALGRDAVSDEPLWD